MVPAPSVFLKDGLGKKLWTDKRNGDCFCVENEYEDDDENDAYEFVNPTRPRSRPR